MFRPQPAYWFEVLVAHDDCAPALAALATNGAIELETRAAPSMLAPLTELKPLLDRYAELARRFARYWPQPQPSQRTSAFSPRAVLQRALGRLSMWHATAEPMVRTVQALEHETRELETWHALLGQFSARSLDFGMLAGSGPVLAHRFYLFPGQALPPVPENALALRFAHGTEQGLVVVAPPPVLTEFDRYATALRGRLLVVPPWLHGQAHDNQTVLERRLQRTRRAAERLHAMLARVGESSQLASALGDIERLRWFGSQVERLPATEHFAWISGWSDTAPAALRTVLADSGARALLRTAEPPIGIAPPLVLRNPSWARPFELFVRALGVPGRDDVDPSPLLALLAPLLFGYMFADVGQGLVLLVAGLLLLRRFPTARLLVAGGGSAMLFGLLFGSVLAREDWLPALWLHPLDAPLTVLGLPLVLGVLLLAFGLVLNGIQAVWRGAGRHWLLTEAGLLVAYLGAVFGLLWPFLFWLSAAGLLWVLAGQALAPRRLGALVPAAGHLFEQLFQLAVNTLSFTRVGAFALAHAGLASAIVALAAAAGHPFAVFLVMLAGNLIVLVLEGLVVSIQTTRLILFEFFIRFLTAEGRPFRPLAAPASTFIERSPA
jgi:V/A-type H+/Na+-transporting ATPase subunit I